MDAVTPAGLREIAARAQQLAADIDAAQAALRGADDDPTRRVGFRLDEAAGYARQAAGELEATAGDLARLRSRPADTCPAQWGCCPEHGNTLRGSGGRSWCTAPGCGRRWEYDRQGLPCAEPVAFEVRGRLDEAGQWGRLCAGHTISAEQEIECVEVRPVTGDRA